MTRYDWESVKLDRAEMAPERLEECDRYNALIDRIAELHASFVDQKPEPLLKAQLKRLMQELERMEARLVPNVVRLHPEER